MCPGYRLDSTVGRLPGTSKGNKYSSRVSGTGADQSKPNSRSKSVGVPRDVVFCGVADASCQIPVKGVGKRGVMEWATAIGAGVV